MSTQEEKLKAIADAIREKDGTTEAIPANDFPERIRAIEGKSSFAAPLVVAADEGAVITATKGDTIITSTAGNDRRAFLTLDQPGAWYIKAQLGEFERGPEKLEVSTGYELTFSFQESRLPEGYIEVEYISNPNLGCIYPVMNNKNPFNEQRIELDIELEHDTTGSIFGSYYYYYQGGTNLSTVRCSNNRLYYDSKDNEIRLLLGYRGDSGYVKYPYSIQAPDGKTNIIVDLPKALYKVNDAEITTEITKNDTSYTYTPALFAEYINYYHKLRPTATTVTSYQRPNNYLNFKLYKFQVYSSTEESIGDLIMDLVPCINPEGVVGVYDLVGNTFTGGYYEDRPFEAGPAI